MLRKFVKACKAHTASEFVVWKARQSKEEKQRYDIHGKATVEKAEKFNALISKGRSCQIALTMSKTRRKIVFSTILPGGPSFMFPGDYCCDRNTQKQGVTLPCASWTMNKK